MPVAILVACSSAPESKHGPLSGSIDGTSFEVLGSYAEARSGVLYVTLTNIAASCAAFPQPSASLLRLDLTLPPQAQGIGSFPLGSQETSPRLSATWFTDAGGVLHQNSLIVETGTLELQAVDPAVAGSLAVTNARAAVSGGFGAEICR
jgi:hypothetical protein